MKKFTLMFPVIILQCSPVASQTTKDAYSAFILLSILLVVTKPCYSY